ncbi:MAG: four helix bundle protein [Chloroflexi bacterium]|nr:four helix bundle protein [Chloroflexota bacterium]
MEGEDKARGWSDHRQMRVWQNADRLDVMVQKMLAKIPKHEFKLRSQIDSASDSIGANFVEGYYSGSLGEYIRFTRYGKRSLGELQERIHRTLRKGYVTQADVTEFDDLAIKTMYLFDRLLSALVRKWEEEKAEKAKRAKEGAKGREKG